MEQRLLNDVVGDRMMRIFGQTLMQTSFHQLSKHLIVGAGQDGFEEMTPDPIAGQGIKFRDTLRTVVPRERMADQFTAVFRGTDPNQHGYDGIPIHVEHQIIQAFRFEDKKLFNHGFQRLGKHLGDRILCSRVIEFPMERAMFGKFPTFFGQHGLSGQDTKHGTNHVR